MAASSPNSPEPGQGPDDGSLKARLQAAIRAERRACLIVNAHSRKGRRLFGAARALLAARGFTLEAAHALSQADRVGPTVADAVAAGHRLIVVGGGDGTLSAAAGSLAHRQAVLGILPLGTANSFARALGIPLDLEGAVGVLADGKVADVDLGTVDGRYFASGAAVGLAPLVGEQVSSGLKRRLGLLAYPLVAVVNLVRHRPFRCTLTQDGRTVEFLATEVRIANGAYQGGIAVAEEAHPDSQELVVQVVKSGSPWRLGLHWVRAALRLPQPEDEMEVLRRHDFVLETSPRQGVSIDGEPIGRTPVRIAVAPQALRLMVPQAFRDLG